MGTGIEPERCPQCGGRTIQKVRRSISYKGPPSNHWECQTCNHEWNLPLPRSAAEKALDDDRES